MTGLTFEVQQVFTVEIYDRLRTMSKAVITFQLPFEEDQVRQATHLEWVATEAAKEGYEYDIFNLYAYGGRVMASHRVPAMHRVSSI
jgi:hypothetical protein